jgi:hypothetical protein
MASWKPYTASGVRATTKAAVMPDGMASPRFFISSVSSTPPAV